MTAQSLTINIAAGGQGLPGSTGEVRGLLQLPERAIALYVLAHGAGAGMTHPFMAAAADALEARGIGTLRYQFPFMEQGSRRPDRPPLAQATVRAAVAEAARLTPSLPLFAGGKSFGGRMTSQAQAAAPLTGVRGLIFLGFPLHLPGKPSADRARHLGDVHIPMLFLQGTRDAMAEQPLLIDLVRQLGKRAILDSVEDGDHSFHVPVRSLARSGQTGDQVLAVMFDRLTAWVRQTVDAGPQASHVTAC